MAIRKLLYATDIREPDFAEVERLLSLRKLGLEEVIFLAAGKVEDWEGKLDGYGVRFKTLAGEGPLVSRILSVARQEAASVIAASLNRDARRLLRSSLTKNLLRSSSVPGIILHHDAQILGVEEKGLFSHIVFATDWLPVSEKALEYLLGFKEIVRELEIVNVINKKLSVREMRNLKKRLEETRKIFLDHGMDAEAHVYAGKPPEEIMEAARDYDATCIVMGTTRKGRDIFSRSCSYRVAEEAAVPTLVIP